TQDIVRQAITTLYGPTPDGLPGNDDLGTMSAWYIWSAIGLYPQNPAVRRFDVGSPLFTSVVIHSPANGPSIDVEASAASATTPYVQALRVNGRPSQNTWVDLPLRANLRLDFDLGAQANKQWGTAPENAPPSYATTAVHFIPATAVHVDAPAVSVKAGQDVAAQFVFENVIGTKGETVHWTAALPQGLHVSTSAGTAAIPAGKTLPVKIDVTADASLAGGYYGIVVRGTASNGAALERKTLVVRVDGSSPHPIAWAQNRFGNTVVPVDLVTGVAGPEIAAGQEPRDAILNQGRLFVTDRGNQRISVVDTVAQGVVATIKVGHAPCGIAIAPVGTTAWIANGDDGTIQSIDLVRLTAGAPIEVGANPRAIAIAPDGKTLYVTDSGSNEVTPVDVATRTAQAPIFVGGRPMGIAITPNGKTIYVVNNANNNVTPIDVATRHALPAIAVGVSPMLVAMSPDGSLAYVSNYANSTITPIEVATNTAKTPIAVGGAPYGVAFTSDGKTALIVARRDNSMVTLDLATKRVSAPIFLGNGPYTVAAP
ncbi:MAG TPA: glycoside hydrolase domain-containing protein, partial [Candidatus Baltobacteraceae bacterium]|nr:glycoside hydrolase domain-containing protein [Candidatus Baltobacteraceae bacterium]